MKFIDTDISRIFIRIDSVCSIYEFLFWCIYQFRKDSLASCQDLSRFTSCYSKSHRRPISGRFGRRCSSNPIRSGALITFGLFDLVRARVSRSLQQRYVSQKIHPARAIPGSFISSDEKEILVGSSR